MASADNADGILSFRALKLVNDHRNSYGLRYNDYARYRNHCKNRAHRLRSALKLTHGRGKEFKKQPTVSFENTKSGHLQLLLFEAERAWSHSQELYTISLQPANKDDSSGSKLRHSATNRFRRAMRWSAELFAKGQSLYTAGRLNVAHLLELYAYVYMLSGRFLRFREEFEDSLEFLSLAYVILSTLADAATTSRDQALATFFSDSIAPEIRYCAHQLGIKDAHDVDRIAKDVGGKAAKKEMKDFDGLVKRVREESGDDTTKGRGRLRDMEWEGQKVAVRIPELVDVLLGAQNAEEQLKENGEAAEGTGKRQRKGVAAFDAILAALSDAEDVARKLAEAQKTTGSSSSRPGEQDIHFLHAFIVYQLLSRRIERDLTLVSALIESSKRTSPSSKPKSAGASTPVKQKPIQDEETPDARVNPAVVKLLDTVLQSLTHMRSLAIVDESPDIANGIELRMGYTRAQRCLFLSRSYAVVKQYAKATLLLQRASTYLREAQSFLSPSSSPSSQHLTFFPLPSSTLTTLTNQLSSDESKVKQSWFAFNGGHPSAERDANKKPLHFDIAVNYVGVDMEALYRRAGMEATSGLGALEKERGSVGASVMGEGGKTRADVGPRAETPEPSAGGGAGGGATGGQAKGGLSSLLGGWWGRK